MINRSIKPEPRGEISFNLPNIQKFELHNGLNVLFVQNKRLPIIQMTLICNAGTKLDPNEKKGLSNLLGALIDEGAGSRNALELSNTIDSLGSAMSIFSDPDSMFITLLTLSDNFVPSLNLFSDIITKPRFEENDFQREKRKALTRIIQSGDEPSYIATSVFEKLVFGNIPYGLPDSGTTETVSIIENNDVKIFYKSLITPNNSSLVVVGNIDQDDLKGKLNSSLNDWQTYVSPIFDFIPPADNPPQIYFVNKEDAAQSEIRMGHLTTGRNSPDFYAKTVMNNILGGQFSSRINLNLRENKGYTYGAHSGFNYNKLAAYFYTAAAVNTENTGDSISEMLKELERIKIDLTEKEVRFAKSSIIRKYPSLFETYGQIARNLANIIIHSLPDDYFNNYIEYIKKVEFDDALSAAGNNIHPENMIILAVGDRSKVLPQLEALHIGNIIELDKEGNQPEV